ncbi:hypothetical protein V8C42DRAFT_357610 [Trichoderma barbatum]
MPRHGAFYRKSKKATPADPEAESLSRTVADFGDWVKGEMQKDRESQAEGMSGFHHLQSPFAVLSDSSELRDASTFQGDEQAQKCRGSYTKGDYDYLNFEESDRIHGWLSVLDSNDADTDLAAPLEDFQEHSDLICMDDGEPPATDAERALIMVDSIIATTETMELAEPEVPEQREPSPHNPFMQLPSYNDDIPIKMVSTLI